MSDFDEITLPEHEAHSEQRAERVIAAVQHQPIKEEQIMEHGVSDKVEVKNIFEPGRGEGGGMGGMGTAAVIAALGNRNEGGGAAAMLPALLAGRGHDGLGMGGFGAGLVGGVLGGLLFGGRRGGLFGGDEGGGGGGAETRIDSTIVGTAVLTKLGSIEAAIPLASAQTENVILQQTNQITNLASQAQLANAAGFASVKDSVQNVGAALAQALCNVNQNISAQGCQTREAIAASTTAILQKIDANTIDDLRARADRAERSVEVNALRSTVEINNTATATSQQAQGQFQVQAQFQDLNNRIGRLVDLVSIVHQEARATNNNVIAGNTGAVTTGAQTANPTNVNV